MNHRQTHISLGCFVPNTLRKCLQQYVQANLRLPQSVQHRVFEVFAATCQRNSSRPPSRGYELTGEKSNDFIHTEAGVH